MATLQQIADGIGKARRAGNQAAVEELTAIYERERARLYELRYGPQEKEEAGFFENIGTGLASGFVGTFETAALGAATLQEEEAELKSRKKIKEIADSFTPEGGDKDSLTYKLASGVGSLGAFLPTAFLGKAALPAAGLLAMGTGTGEASERAREYGATEEERNIAARKGAAIGLTEIIPLGKLSSKLKIPGLPEALEKIGKKVSPETITGIRTRLQRAAATGVTEGAQEAAAAVLQNLTEQGYNPEQVLFEAGVVEEGAIGGGAGAILQGVVDLLTKRTVSGGPDDRSVTEKETSKPAKEEPKKDPAPAEADDTQEESVPEPKVRPKKKTNVETKVTAFLNRLDSDKLEGMAADPARLEKDAKNAGLSVGTYELMVKNAISKKKEAADVGEQVTGTPDTKTTGESVPSGTGVVGDKRADGTKKPRGAVEGGLDDSVGDTGRPTGRKRKSNAAIKNLGLKPGQKLDLSKVQEQFKGKQPTTQETRKQLADAEAVIQERQNKRKQKPDEPKLALEVDAPSVNPDTSRFTYKKSKKLITSHSALEKDMVAIRQVAGMSPAKDIGRLSSEAKKVKEKPENERTPKEKRILASDEKLMQGQRKTLNNLNTVRNYLNSFDSPMDALYNAVYEVAESGTQMKAGKKGSTSAWLEAYSNVDKMKPLTENLGPRKAKLVLQWANKNLSKETKRQLAARREEFAAKIKKELEKDVTQQELNQKALARQQRVNKKAAETDSKIRRSDVKEARATKGKESEVVSRIEKEGTDEPATPKADGTVQRQKKQLSGAATQQQYFERVLVNQKAKLAIPSFYKKAVDYAMRGTTPNENMKRLATAMNEVTQDKKEVSEILAKERRERQAAKVESPKEKTVKRANKRFVGKKGVTKQDILAAYNMEGARYVKKAKTADAFVGMAETYKKQKENDYSYFMGNAKVAEALRNPASEATMKLLEENNISEALLQISKELKDPQLKAIARALSKNMGNTKVEFLSDKDIAARTTTGEGVFGMFDPTSNSILLNMELPLDNHIIMHEAGHAGLDVAVARNPSSSYAKDLTSLYEEVKDDLGTAYGKKNLREFLAEASSSPSFRKELSGILAKRASALSRFLRAVANFFRSIMGLETKVLRDENMTLDKVDTAIMEIMRPTPDFVNIRTFINPPTPSLMSTIIGEQTGRTERAKTGFIDAFKNKQLGKTALRGLTKVMHLNTLAEVARANGFGQLGYNLFRAIEKGRGLLNQNKKIVDKAMEIHTEFSAEVGAATYRDFNELIYNENFGATLYQVNPYKKRKEYEGKYDKSGNELAEIWDLQQKHINRIPSKYRGKVEAEFKRGLAFYKQQYVRLKEALDFELQNVLEKGDAKAARAVRDKLTELLFADGALEVYYPLVREGDFRVSLNANVEDVNGNKRKEKMFFMFKNISERDAFVKLAEKDPDVYAKSISVFDSADMSNAYNNRPEGTFVADVLDTLSQAKISEEVQQSIMQMYINTLPETSFARSFAKRNGTLGFIKNAGIALETKGYSLAAQIAKISNASEVRAISREIKVRGDELTTPAAKVISTALRKDHADFAISGASFKTLEQYFKAANQFAFVYTLGFNVSSAIVNLSQIPLFVVPYLGARYGYENTVNQFMKAARMVLSTKASLIENYNVEGAGEGAIYTLKESVKEKIRKHTDAKEAEKRIEELEDLIPIVKEAHLRGKLYTWDTLMEVGTRERATFFDKFAHLSALAFNAGERFNTQTTLVASYNLIRQQMVDAKKAGKKYFSPRLGKEVDVPTDLTALRDLAAQDAMIQAQETNGGATLETTMPVAKEHVGRVAFMYKSYGVLMNTAMIKSYLISTDRYFKDNPEQKKIARKQLLGVHLSSLLLAGIGGMPIYGLISMIVDLFRDDDEDSADEMTRKFFSELGFKGPLVAATGADVAARIKLNDLIFQENRFMRDPSLEESIGFYLGGPAFSTVKRYFRAKDDIVDGEYQRAFESILPGGLSSLAVGYRYGTEGIQTRRDGDFIYEDITGGEIAAKVFGFAPAEYTFRQEQSARNTRVTNDIKQLRSKLTKKYYLALRQRDYDRAEDIYKDITEFNKKYGKYGITIDRKSIRNSLKRHAETSATMHNGVAVSPMYRELLRQSNNEYKQ